MLHRAEVGAGLVEVAVEAQQEWLSWFEPDERSRWWWSARVEDDHHLRLSVEVDAWPVPFG